jgi:hypothetical protein
LKEGAKLSTYCRKCKAHTVQESLRERGSSEEEQVDELHVLDHEVTDTLLQCETCKTWQIHTFRYTQPTEWEREEFIPPHPNRVWPPWAESLPMHMRELLREVHVALAAEQRWLVGMGCRTLIDMFAIEMVGDVGGFWKKVKRLEREEIISPKDALVIEAAINLGHDAAHSIKSPTNEGCRQVLDIVEHLLQRLSLVEHASRLREHHPKRAWPK